MGGRESPSHYINWQQVLPDSTKHLHHFCKLSLCISPTRVCVRIPQAATEDHGICRDAERRGHQGCGPGLSKWVRKRACMHTMRTGVLTHTHIHCLSRADGMQLKVLCSNIIFRCFCVSPEYLNNLPDIILTQPCCFSFLRNFSYLGDLHYLYKPPKYE